MLDYGRLLALGLINGLHPGPLPRGEGVDSRLRGNDEGMAPLWSPRRDGGTGAAAVASVPTAWPVLTPVREGEAVT